MFILSKIISFSNVLDIGDTAMNKRHKFLPLCKLNIPVGGQTVDKRSETWTTMVISTREKM